MKAAIIGAVVAVVFLVVILPYVHDIREEGRRVDADLAEDAARYGEGVTQERMLIQRGTYGLTSNARHELEGASETGAIQLLQSERAIFVPLGVKARVEERSDAEVRCVIEEGVYAGRTIYVSPGHQPYVPDGMAVLAADAAQEPQPTLSAEMKASIADAIANGKK